MASESLMVLPFLFLFFLQDFLNGGKVRLMSGRVLESFYSVRFGARSTLLVVCSRPL